MTDDVFLLRHEQPPGGDQAKELPQCDTMVTYWTVIHTIPIISEYPATVELADGRGAAA